jgi:hypothetical protein
VTQVLAQRKKKRHTKKAKAVQKKVDDTSEIPVVDEEQTNSEVDKLLQQEAAMAENVKNDTYLEDGNLADEEIADIKEDTSKKMKSFFDSANADNSSSNTTENSTLIEAPSTNDTVDSLNETELSLAANDSLVNETLSSVNETSLSQNNASDNIT